MLTVVVTSFERVFTHGAAPVARPCPGSDRDLMNQQKKAARSVSPWGMNPDLILANHGMKRHNGNDFFLAIFFPG